MYVLEYGTRSKPVVGGLPVVESPSVMKLDDSPYDAVTSCVMYSFCVALVSASTIGK